MKKKLMDAGILAAVFIIAVIFFEVLLSRNDRDLMADIGNATLPRVYFSVEGYAVNPMNGYVEEMDVTTMRGAITPVSNNQLLMNLVSDERTVSSVDYAVYSQDGKDKLYENSIEKISDQMKLTFDDGVMGSEKLLEVTLHTEEGDVFYYTRVVDPEGFQLVPCMDYIYNFHENALAKKENAGVGKALESNSDMANDSFYHVTINSDYDHVTWGELNPQVVGGERWTIQETNENYTSVLLEYEVYCTGEENESDLYTVREFFRVRSAVGNLYLLNYDRTMEQLFDGSKNVLSSSGISLGITSSDVDYEVNADGTIVAFVQANELWNYNSETNEMALLFSFRDAENADVRNKVMDHEIRILGMDKNGNTTFAVTGYMNRGAHEGRVGMVIYYYDIDTNSTTEKAFIPSEKFPEIAREQFANMTYYSTKQDCLYMILGGTLYEIDVENNLDEALTGQMGDDQYAASESGKWIAYQTGEDMESSTEAVVKNLYNGEEYTVQSEEENCIVPLGFVKDDFVCGYAKKNEIGQMISGEKAVPMYLIEIRNSDNEVIKTYETDGDVVLGASISDGMITLNLGKKNGDTYTFTSDDYIANNDEKEQSNITLESYSTELKEKQQRITFGDGIESKTAKVLKPKQVMNKNAVTSKFHEEDMDGRFYVYGLGSLQGIYKNAGYAIQNADKVSGVVVDSERNYVWERGNWASSYEISGQDTLLASMVEKLKAGESALKVVNEISDGKGMELTGCSTEEVYYMISKGTPVIAVRESASPLLLVGYDQNSATITYMDTENGVQSVGSLEQIDQMMQSNGSIFIGYLPDLE